MKKLILSTLMIAAAFLGRSQGEADVIYCSYNTGNPSIQAVRFSIGTGEYFGSGFDMITSSIHGTSAIGKTGDWLYYLRYGSNSAGDGDGRVRIYAVHENGSGHKQVGTFDLNGNSNSELSFVRLGMDRNAYGWIVAKQLNGNTIYLGRFKSNGNSNVTVERLGTLTTSDNNNQLFSNGDLAFDGTGRLYVLANNNSTTKIYDISPEALAAATSNSSTTLNYRWTLKKANGTDFSGQVNGCAFSSAGHMFISTADGIYWIDQYSVNFAGTGTVLCEKKLNASGISDLASDFFPEKTYLPIKFHKFTTRVIDKNTVEVKFTVAEADDVDSYEIEVSTDGKSWKSVMLVFNDTLHPNRTYTFTIKL